MRARASSLRTSGVAGMRSSSSTASSGRSPSMSSPAKVTVASSLSGSISRAARSDASSPASTSRSTSVSSGAGTSFSMKSRTAASPWAPMNPSTTWPSFMAYTAGIDWTRNAWATPGFLSMSTLASSTRP